MTKRHSMPITILAAITCSSAASSAAPSIKKAMPTRQYQELITKPALAEAMREVGQCVNASVLPSTCQGTWKGIRWTLATRNWLAQLDLPDGSRWIGNCEYDAIESDESCSWTTGDQFLLVRGSGYRVFVNWGNERFPGSEMIARFDNENPVRTTAQSWTNEASRAIFNKMMSKQLLRYRWFSWPEESAHDGTIRLAGFADVAALMEGIKGYFVVNRALKKID